MKPLATRHLLLTLVILWCLGGALWAKDHPLAHWRADDPTRGSAILTQLTTSVGLSSKAHVARKFSGAGASMNLTLDLSGSWNPFATGPVLLEIREIHQASRQAFGYSVKVGQKTVYVRTYEELISSPLTWFATVNRSLISDPNAVSVTITSLGGGPFAISDIWGHGDFQGLMTFQGLEVPLQISEALLGKDISSADNVHSRYPEGPDFTYGTMLGSSYLDRPRPDLYHTLEGFLACSQKANIPLAIMLSRWWGHTATSLDGLGGAFGDVAYNQVTWDPVSKSFGLTTPNQWGNTPWPGMNSAVGNKFAQRQLEAGARRLANRYALMQAEYGQIPPCDLVMEWGSGYWQGGDFSHEVVADAQRDGVALDPRDGLTEQEIAWMQLNIARYNHLLAEAYVRGLGSDAIIVRQGNITEPQRQLASSIYTHCLQGQLYPSFDDRLPGWVGGVGPHMWPSSEMYQFVDQRHNEYSLEYGPLTCVNLEMTMLRGDDFRRYLLTSFANGMQTLVMFNQDAVKMKLADQIKAAGEQFDQRAPAPTLYLRQNFDVDLLRDGQPQLLKSLPKGWEIANLAYEPGHGTYIGKGYLHTVDPTTTGSITFPIQDSGLFSTGLLLELQGRTTKSNMAVFAGPDVANLVPVQTFKMGPKLTWFNAHSRDVIDLSEVARGKGQVMIRLELTGKTTSIRAIRALLPWGLDCGPVESPATTWRDRRLQSLWIQQRAITQRATDDYIRKRGGPDAVTEEAKDLVVQGRLSEATKLLQKEISHLLPARFAIAGNGLLGRIPVEVRLPSAADTVVLLVEAFDGKSIRFETFSDKAMTLLMRRVGAKGQGKIETISGANIYSASSGNSRSDSGEKYTVTWIDGEGEGWVSVPLSGQQDQPNLAGKTLQGRVTSLSKSHLSLEPWGAMRLEMSGSQRKFPLAPNCIFRHRLGPSAEVTADRPEVDDAVDLTLDDQSRVVLVEARRGLVTGTIAAFEPSPLVTPNPHNGLIRLEDGQVFELSLSKNHSTLKVPPFLDGLALKYTIPQLVEAFKPGLKVTLRFCPGQAGREPERIV